MRLTFLFLFVGLMQVSASLYSQSTKLRLDFRNARVVDVLEAIEKQSEFRFAYSAQYIDMNRKVNVDVKDKSIEQTLSILFDGAGVRYSINDRHIMLFSTDLEPGDTQQQKQKSITGKITDSSGALLPGVSVVVKGTTYGTITDANGNYSLSNIPENAVLQFSFVGMKGQEAKIVNQSKVNITMEDDAIGIEEVVAIGYGTQKKTSTTAAVSTLKADMIAQKPVVNLSNSLIGRVSGVIADQGSGEPGQDGARIRIRGNSTLGNGSPLLVVDGIYRDFSRLDPNSVESITILKDAAAVAPYGLAGANGVILVTTKKGKTGAPTLTYNTFVGVQNPTRLMGMVNSYQYTLLRNEAALNDNLPNIPFTAEQISQYKKTVDGASDADPDKYPNSRGLRDVLQSNALMTHHNMELSGGAEKFHYYTSIGYMTQQGQFPSTNLKKYNLLANIDVQATNTTKVALSVNGWIEDQNYAGKGGASANGGIMYQAFRTPPTSAIYYSNGYWGSYIGRSLVGYIEHSGYRKNENSQIMTSLSIEQKLPIEGLSVKAVVSYDPNTSYSKIWQTPIPVYSLNTATTPYTYDLGYVELNKPKLELNNWQNKAFTYQGYINYNHAFGKHDITALGVFEYRNQKDWWMNASRINYPIDIDELDRGSTDPEDISNSGSSSAQRQIGYVYRFTYNYAGKYMAEVAGRYDGHYYFAPGKRFGFFPSFSLGWNMAEESFLKGKYKWLDVLKMRTSYGESGNLAGSAFQYLTGYGLYGNSAVFNGVPTAGIYETKQGNPNITWERACKFDIGLESVLLNGKFRFEMDYFYEKRSDMLLAPQVIVPLEYGIGLNEENAGIMSNQGFELSFGSRHQIRDINLTLDGTLTFAKNKLIQVFETDATYDNPNRRRTGRSNGTQFGLEALGYFQTEDFNPDGTLMDGIASIPDANVKPGDLKYLDISGPDGTPDGIIDSNDETVIGKPNGSPQLIFSLSPGLSWKGFDLNLLFQGASMFTLPLGGNIVQPFAEQGSASLLVYNDHWTPENTDALYPRVTSQPTDNNTRYSSWWVRDATYIKLRSMEFGYTIPTYSSRKIGIQTVRIYTSGQNLFTWTPNMEETIDPEAGSGNGQYYFQQKVFSVGLNITF